MNALILKNDGLIYVCTLREEPEYCPSIKRVRCDDKDCWIESLSRYGCFCNLMKVNYEAAQEKAIKEAVVCADQKQAFNLIDKHDFALPGSTTIAKDTPYIIPGLDFEVKDECIHKDITICQTRGCCTLRKVAILILPKQDEEPSKPAFTDEEFKEVLRMFHRVIKERHLADGAPLLKIAIDEAEVYLESKNYFNFNQSDLV
jgi:hypothetical protein